MKPPSRILIVGSRGMLGTDLVLESGRLFSPGEVLALNSSQLDFTNAKTVFDTFQQFRPTVVLNAAAYTNVDGAETEREKARALNVLGPMNLVEACHEHRAKLVHFTTDYVFSGEPGRVWKETDAPCPPQPNYYAQTKLEGEEKVKAYDKSLTLRVQWLYGRARDRFTPLKEKKTFTPFIDQVGAPTWTREIARTVFKLLDRDVTGLFHFSYDDHASWFEVYQFVKEKWNLPIELIPKRTAEVTLPAKRPLNCVLSNRELCRALGVSSMGSWKTPFSEFLK